MIAKVCNNVANCTVKQNAVTYYVILKMATT